MDALTVVLSPSSAATPERTEYQDELCNQLKASGWPTIVVPDLYQHRDGESAQALRRLTGPLVALSWLEPRALYWTLRGLGVEGERVASVRETHGSARPIACLDLSTKCCPGKWVEALQAMGAAPAADAETSFREIRAETTARWYPIIDYDRCTGCGECLEFCLFGVYDADDEGNPVASSPDSCKPGCPACSRVCPATAIMFPLFEGDDVIAGADTGEITPFRAEDVARVRAACERGELSQEDVVKACACQNDRAADAKSQARDCGCDCDGDGSCDRAPDQIDSMLDETIGK